VSLYLDASVLVTLFVIDPSSARAEAFLSAHPEIVVVGDFGVAEFSSAVGRRVRTHDLTREDGQLAFSNFDTWVARSAYREEITTADIDAANGILRRLESGSLGAARAPPPPACHREVRHHIAGQCEIVNSWTYHVSNERVMPDRDPRIFAFPAGSLPSLRLLPNGMSKSMIALSFSA
jgi:hypothetical protein